MGGQGTDAAAAEDVAFDADHAEIRGSGGDPTLAAGTDIEQADAVGTDLAGEPPPGIDRDRQPVVEPDASTKEQDRGVAGAAPGSANPETARSAAAEAPAKPVPTTII